MDTVIRVQIMDEADCILRCTNTLEKCMNPNILPPALSKLWDILGLLTSIRQPILEKDNSEFKLFNLDFYINFVSILLKKGGVNTYVLTKNMI